MLVPELLDWSYAKLDPDLRKSFEVALHAGTATALAIALRREVVDVLRTLDRRRVVRHSLTLIPVATMALVFERAIEQRLGSARRVAVAQILGGLALGCADSRPAVRDADDAGTFDYLAIGLAQAMALAPGVSRNGATLTAARLRRFAHPAANRLSRHAALPVIAAASALKGSRLARRGLAPELAATFAAGAAAAFCSTLASAQLVAALDRAPSYVPFAAYRVGLGGLVIAARRGRPA